MGDQQRATPRRQQLPKSGQGDSASQLADGMAARQVAVSALHAVFVERRSFDDAFARAASKAQLPGRDRGFARAIAATVLRRRGQLNEVVSRFIEKPLPAKQGQLDAILLSAAAQLLYLATPPHAAISLAVDQCRTDRNARRFDKLTNAVLRRVSERGPEILKTLDAATLNVPPWLSARWQNAYGADLAKAIAEASLVEAPLDLSVKSDPKLWAEKLGGIVVAERTVRLSEAGRIEDLDGYGEGAWWVQDAAASLPAKLLGDVKGLDVADICAAPGGKTAQLLAAGARVTAVDQSQERLTRLQSNLARLGFSAAAITADAATWSPGKLFDAILVDAPCTATGTIRRHPDILHLKRADDVAALADIQRRILENAAKLVRPGGKLVFCTCSLEPEEGPEQISRFLDKHPEFERQPAVVAEIGGEPGWVTGDGDIRTLPTHLDLLPPGQRGLDGFYAARLVHKPI